jgi:hypothetical protein
MYALYNLLPDRQVQRKLHVCSAPTADSYWVSVGRIEAKGDGVFWA